MTTEPTMITTTTTTKAAVTSKAARRRPAFAMLGLGLLALTAAMQGCTTNAATGKSQFNALTRESEIALGSQYQPELITEMGGEVSNAAVQAYIVEIGSKLASLTEGDNPSLPWEFTLLDSDVINAFALPGGKVFISRGLAVRFANEAQLASVMGHEVGHVTARHINDSMVTQMGASTVGSMIAAALGTLAGQSAGAQTLAGAGSTLAEQGAGLVALKFGRDQEIEADLLGIRYMVKAGYNPIGSRDGMQVLADAAGGGGQSDFFSTHPDPARRVDIIQDVLESEHPQALANPTANLYTEEFRRRFLQPMAQLDHASPVNIADSDGESNRRGVTSWWCMVCEAPVATVASDDQH